MSFPGASGSGSADAPAGWAFNPPPGWPAPPAGWTMPEDWQPDPSWPPAPEGWVFWVPAHGPGGAGEPLTPTPYEGLAVPSPTVSDAPPGAAEVRLSLGEQSRTARLGQEARIGRSPDNDIVVNDPTVSRQHAVVRSGVSGWEYAKAGSAPTFLDGQMVDQVAVDRALDFALGSPDGPVLHIEPVTGAVRLAPAGAQPQAVPWQAAQFPAASAGPDPNWRLTGSPSPQPAWAGPGPGAPGPGAPSSGAPGWFGGPATNGDDLASALRILFPIHSWLNNSGWRQGLRLGVIAYALLPLIFLTVLSGSNDLAAPGWAYSLYVAPLWLIGFWLLIRPPDGPSRQEIVIAVAIVIWTVIWLNVVTVTINDALPTKNGIGLGSAIVIGLNEETTKALPVLLAGLILLRRWKIKLDVRMWMIFGTIAGLTFGIVEQAIYTSNDIVIINMAHSQNEAVQATLAFAERVFVDGFQHAVWAGISGFFMGLAVNYRRRRVQLVLIGIAIPALLHAANDWLAGDSPWIWIAIQAASLLLFLGYTMSAASIEQKVRETPIFRGDSIIMEAFRLPDQPPRR
jgi:RsiW-degrading membrane proteinase PrsW (M82 family)